MKSLICLIIYFILTLSLNGQSVFYSTFDNNRISKDSVLRIIRSSEAENPGRYFTAFIIDTKTFPDSTIHWTMFERHRLDTSPEPIRIWRFHSFVGQPFPWSKMKSLDSNFELPPNNGKMTLVNFWFTACLPCRQELPFLNDLAKTFGDSVNFMAISFEPDSLVNKFLKTNEFNFEHFTDTNQTLIDKIGIDGYPISFLLDEQSVVIKAFHGFHPNDKINNPQTRRAKELLRLLNKE